MTRSRNSRKGVSTRLLCTMCGNRRCGEAYYFSANGNKSFNKTKGRKKQRRLDLDFDIQMC
jgi:hypothetical protein